MKKLRINRNIILSLLLLVGIVFSVIQILQAQTPPNPGHSWSQIGDGFFAVNGLTAPRTFNFPDANAAVLTTATPVTVPQGGTGLSSIAAGGILYSSADNTLSRIAPSAANQVLRSTGANALQIASLVAGDIPSLDASKITSGIFGVARGGTNTSTIGPAGSIAYSTGGAYAFSAAGSPMQILFSGGSGAPVWRDVVNPNLIVLQDEFVSGLTSSGNIGVLAWVLGAGSVAVKAGESAHPGMLTLSSSATANTIGRLVLSVGGTTGMILAADVDYMALLVRPLSGTTAMAVRFGLTAAPGTAGEGAQGIYWSFLPATSPNWRTVTRDGAGMTANTTGVAYTTGVWNFLELRRTASGWEFWRNGVLHFTHTTNIPTVALIPMIAIETTEAVAKTMDVDYFGMRSREFSARY